MENFVKIECCSCGVLFAVSHTLNSNWRRTKADFYCPNGHPQSYIKSTADILREELEEKKRLILINEQCIDELQKENKALKTPKKKKTKIKIKK